MGMRQFMQIVLTLVLSIGLHQELFAQKAKFQSVFIYNFSKYIKWPDAYNGDNFVIGVVGDPEVLYFLKEMAATKKVTNGKPIKIEAYNDINEIGQCQILFISEESCDKMDQINDIIASMPVLTVTEKPGMAKKGSIINFVGKDDKIKFELNMKRAQSRGLIVAGSLAGLAIII
jgi:hypothetical protein